MSRLTQGLAPLALGGILALTGCSAAEMPPPTAQAAPEFNSFDAISRGLGWGNTEDMPVDDAKSYKALQACMNSDGTFLAIVEFNDKAQRDAVLDSPDNAGSSFLFLNDTWAVIGEGDDVIAARNFLNTGELLTSNAEEPTEPDTEEPSEEPTEGTDGPMQETVKLGTAAAYDDEQVKVSKFECGLRIIPKATDSGNYDNDGNTIYEALRAPKGEELCRIDLTWKNVGKKPGVASDFGDVVTANGTQYSADSDLAASGDILSEETRYTETNPGKGYEIVLVYSVPKGADVVGVLWGADGLGDDPYLLSAK